MHVLQSWGVICRYPDSNPARDPETSFLKRRCLTAELPAQMVGLGGPSRVGHDPSQDPLRVSFSGAGRESNLWRGAYDLMPLSTEPQVRTPASQPVFDSILDQPVLC